MSINSTDTWTLVRKIEQVKTPLPYYTHRYFGEILEFDTEEVHFDDVIKERRMAPFVSPLVAGKAMATMGHTMRSFRPAYVKPKHIVDPSKAIKRLPGEAFGGALSPAQRMEVAKSANWVEEDRMIDNRIEWMVVEMLKSGAITVSGKDYPTQVVDFGRAGGLTLTVSTTWDNGAATPMEDIEDVITAMSVAPFGAPGGEIYMDPNAWKNLRSNTEFQALCDKNFAGQNTTMDRAPVAYDPNEDPQMVATAGGGRLKFYVDARQYENDAGTVVPYLASGNVLVVSSQIHGVQAFGAIRDVDELGAMRAYPKTWVEPDPSVRYTMTQSAPLPIAERINASAFLQVL
jgi:hypothetical protein